jgi:competence protein ComEA
MLRLVLLALGTVLLAGCASAHASEPESRFDLAAARPSARPRAAPSPSGVVVYVAGEVTHPGVYHLGPGARVVDALERAGNAKPDADLISVNLAAPLRDGEEIAVGAKGERIVRAPRARARSTHAPRGTRRSRKRATAPSAPLDLNTADAQSLASLPGVGLGLAERIVQFRDANGPFDSVDELADVAGITDRRLEQLAPYLTVSGR